MAPRGPARKNQNAAPIADAMRAYWERNGLSFSIPADGGGRSPTPEFAGWAGIDAARFDIRRLHVLVDAAQRELGRLSDEHARTTKHIHASPLRSRIDRTHAGAR